MLIRVLTYIIKQFQNFIKSFISSGKSSIVVDLKFQSLLHFQPFEQQLFLLTIEYCNIKWIIHCSKPYKKIRSKKYFNLLWFKNRFPLVTLYMFSDCIIMFRCPILLYNKLCGNSCCCRLFFLLRSWEFRT